jgi:hypothetical protein
MNAFIQTAAQQSSKQFKMYVLALSSCMFFTPRAGSLDEVWMLLHHS